MRRGLSRLADLLLIGKVKGFPRKPQRIAGAGKRGVHHVQRRVGKISGGQSAAEVLEPLAKGGAGLGNERRLSTGTD